MPKQKSKQSPHRPVLLAEVLEYLKPQKGQSYLDLTAGFGGHAQKIIHQTGNPKDAVLVDRDKEAVEYLKTTFNNSDATILHTDFKTALDALEKKHFDLILADLGASSLHFDSPERGFSFSQDGPLDMRMDQSQTLTADYILNNHKESDIARILRDYGQEPMANTIARKIVQNRPIHTTAELSKLVGKVYWKHTRLHPSTKIFQALRIAVNEELQQLEDGLPKMLELLNPGGRLAIISFHSLEDGLVKRCLAEHTGDRYDAQFELLTKKPVVPGPEEIDINPRARSAKLRAVAKIKTKRKD